MKIAVIAHAYHPISQPFFGGMETHTHHLVAELVRAGNDVTLYAKAGTTTSATLVTMFDGDAKADKNPAYWQAYERTMDMVGAGDYDLIINNSIHHIPLVRHNLDMAPMLTIFHIPPLPNMIPVLESQPMLANRSYLAVSDFTAKQWQPHCADRINVVSNGLDISGWKHELHSPARPSAAWVGRITPEKGTHVAIEACLQTGIPLTLAGNIFNQAYFDDQIKPLLRHPTISYVGHADHKSINALFMAASVALVTPLWDEPFGLVQVEAWTSGTPVAALPNGALPSLVHDGVGRLAASDTAGDLADALLQAMSVNRSDCRRYAETNFSLSAMVEGYMAHASELLETSRVDLAWQPLR